jgi:hypothetical protein
MVGCRSIQRSVSIEQENSSMGQWSSVDQFSEVFGSSKKNNRGSMKKRGGWRVMTRQHPCDGSCQVATSTKLIP